MTAEAHIDPTRAAFDAFKALPRDVPLNMLNLIRFNERAAYPEGHEHAGKGWSGHNSGDTILNDIPADAGRIM